MASACWPAMAAAQPRPEPIAVGGSVSGTLSESDPELADRHYDSYRIRLRKGEAIQADMKSEALDSYLDVIAEGGQEPLKAHDDVGGGSRDSRLRFVAPDSGEYILRAQGFSGGTGDYSLSVKSSQVAPPPRLIPLDSAGEASGRFTDSSPLDDDDHPYALYSFPGKKGERVRIDMVSSGLDPQLELSLEEGGDFKSSNDDGGEGLDSRIFAVLPSDGTYRLRARSLNSEAGSYGLRLQRFAPAGPPQPPGRLRRDSPTMGRLSFDDPGLEMAVDEAGQPSFFYRLYALPLNAGETVTIDLKAESFDPVLDAGVMSPLGFAVARTNDDAQGQGTNSRLVLTPAGTGTIYVRARTLNPESLGEYTLTVSSGAPPAAPPASEEGGDHH
ncbi:MAG TPA: PPC domain-containing protein [Allosphingosinicella sp.]